MTPTIAEVAASPSYTPGELAAWLGIFAFLLGVAVLIKKLFVREPSLHQEFVTKEQHEQLRREIEKIDNERRVSSAKLHEKIEENTKITAGLGGKLEMMNQNFHQLNTTITTFLQNLAKK